jgi:hypothetical protein
MKRTIDTAMATLHFHHEIAASETNEKMWRHAFRLGAQHCREMLAAFIEQGGDPRTAASIRANWDPTWGKDPGAPSHESE